MSTLSPIEIAYEKAHINETRQPACYGVVITFYVIAIILVVIRLAVRRQQKTMPSLDDYLSIAGIIFLIPFISATLGEVANGIGRHSITVTTHESIMQMKWEVVNLYSYTMSITTIKLSILALLGRIFVTAPRSFHICIYILACWMVLWAIALIFAYSFQCRPFSSQWSLSENCSSSLKLEYSASILNAVHDVMMFCLPQRIIWNLHLAARKKLAVSISFFIGLVATLMALLKIAYIQGAPGTSHKSDLYAIAPALIFNAMEPLLASICSCLPAIPYFFRHVRLDSFYQLSSLFRSSRSVNNSKESAINIGRNNRHYPPSNGASTESITELTKRPGEEV
ncbi:hypothetical protein BO85DRAFT_491975 [Aspergillus piperis CBS 112811]|uniref:Rhodopsin domain-containing protein n=1 Tax=Aspergillus piperis CBS 112811 TaxID=1448313 RepID=A0A8G1QSF7_9EURO|nr:hypothetical protein BO85DRAFT_491975 [Aspergillus piperis CBS 112811]RAH53456.1 hypothetical protein BO85DRAFT_491975 [Aspergillus piperis CBS 112811]